VLQLTRGIEFPSLSVRLDMMIPRLSLLLPVMNIDAL